MIEAAKCLLQKLLGEASDDLERVTPRTRERLCTETTENKRRCSRPETPREKPCSRFETLTEKIRSRFEMPGENLCGKRQQMVHRCHNLLLSHWRSSQAARVVRTSV